MTPKGYLIARDDSGERVGWWVWDYCHGIAPWPAPKFIKSYRAALAWIRRRKSKGKPR